MMILGAWSRSPEIEGNGKPPDEGDISFLLLAIKKSRISIGNLNSIQHVHILTSSS